MAPAPVRPRHQLLADCGVVVLYLAIAIAMTWPLAITPGRVPADLADPLLSIWLLWWNATTTPFTDTWWHGLAFFPASDTLTLSDHRLGLGLLTTPAMVAGASPVAAYSAAFIASFILSAAAAYWLCVAVTGSRLAAFIGGLIFGFNPFRAGHLEHLELLSAHWLPMMLLALHMWRQSGRHRWLAAYSIAAVLQALTSGYYFVFSMVLVGLWTLWFATRPARIPAFAALSAALLAPMVVIAPLLLRYHQAHERMGLRRSITEIETFSADISGLLTAPERLWLWDAPAAWQRPEVAILPGALAVIVVGIASALELRARSHGGAPGLRRVRASLAILAALAGIGAILPAIIGPVDTAIGPLRISISDSFKPLTLTIVFLLLLAATSAGVRRWLRERSQLGFYVLATLAMWALAFGPTVRLLGEPVFYKAPYSWLMLIPGFTEAFRAPARFALLAALTLAVAAALACDRLLKPVRPAMRALAAACLAIAVMAESWVTPLTLFDAPPPLQIPHGVPADATIMEWPPGVYEDAAAMYRSTQHRRRVVNGLSGHQPPHYAALVASLADGQVEAMMPLAAFSDIVVFFARNDPETPSDVEAFSARTGAAVVADTGTHIVSLLRRQFAAVPPGTPPPAVRQLSFESATNADALRFMIDGDYSTAWGTPAGQSGTEQFVAALPASASIGGVIVASGDRVTLFARQLAVDLSLDKRTWTECWRGALAAPSVAAAIARPARMDVSITFPRSQARYVRVRQLGRSLEPWAVAEFAVITAR